MGSKVRSIQREIEKRKAAESTITVKLSQLVESIIAFNSLIVQPLPAREAFKIARVVKLIKPELETYNETRKALCEKHGTLIEGAANYDLGDNEAAFKTELDELLASEITLQVERIKLEAIGGANLSAAQLVDLDWLISE